MAGRVTQLNSVLSAMPSYLMQTTMLPDNVIKEFEKFTRDFFGVDMRRNEVYTLLTGKLFVYLVTLGVLVCNVWSYIMWFSC